MAKLVSEKMYSIKESANKAVEKLKANAVAVMEAELKEGKCDRSEAGVYEMSLVITDRDNNLQCNLVMVNPLKIAED